MKGDEYVSQFEIQIVGSSQVHQKLWIPAEQLAEFDRDIFGKIKVVEAYYGDKFTDPIDPITNLPVAVLG